MSRRTITAAETVWVKVPPDRVFAYTQDYNTRPDWDPVIERAEILATDPPKVRVAAKGVGRYVIEYRLFRPGERTSAAFREVDELKHPQLMALAVPLIRRRLHDGMRSSMARAKAILEGEAPGSR